MSAPRITMLVSACGFIGSVLYVLTLWDGSDYGLGLAVGQTVGMVCGAAASTLLGRLS